MRATNEHAKRLPLSQLPRNRNRPDDFAEIGKSSPFRPETPCRYYAKPVLATSKFRSLADLTHAVLPSPGTAASFRPSRRPAAPPIAPVAQLDRAPDYGSGGWEFESLRARQLFGQKDDATAARPGRCGARRVGLAAATRDLDAHAPVPPGGRGVESHLHSVARQLGGHPRGQSFGSWRRIETLFPLWVDGAMHGDSEANWGLEIRSAPRVVRSLE